jgi:PAS domain S-box-containing protein
MVLYFSARIVTGKCMSQVETFDVSFLASVLELNQDCIKIISLEGKLLYMNKGGQHSMEIDDVSSCLDNQWVDFWTGTGKEEAEKSIQRAKEGFTSKFTDFCPTAKGTPRWWEVTVSPITDASGKVKYILASSHDVTDLMNLGGKLHRIALAQHFKEDYKNLVEQNNDLKAVLAQNKELNELLEGALGLCDDNIVVFDRNLNYIMVNETACKTLDRPSSDIIGKCIIDLYPEIIASKNHRNLLSALSGHTIQDDIPSLSGTKLYSTLYKPVTIDGKVMGILVKSKSR